MAKEKTVTRRMSLTPEEAIHIFYMARFIKTAIITPPAEVIAMANKLMTRTRKLYPELNENFDRLEK